MYIILVSSILRLASAFTRDREADSPTLRNPWWIFFKESLIRVTDVFVCLCVCLFVPGGTREEGVHSGTTGKEDTGVSFNQVPTTLQ